MNAAKPVKLDKADREFISANAICPDCRLGFLLIGPRGGASLNVRCDNTPCGQEFDIGLFCGEVVCGDRLARNEPHLYGRMMLARRSDKPL